MGYHEGEIGHLVLTRPLCELRWPVKLALGGFLCRRKLGVLARRRFLFAIFRFVIASSKLRE